MAQSKFLTNNATLFIKANGDVLIKRRRLLSGAGIVAGLLMALGGLGILVNAFSPFSLFSLLLGVILPISGYFVLRAAWRGLREPNILIEKSAQHVSLKPMWGSEGARHWYFSELAGVAIWHSGHFVIGSDAGDVSQVDVYEAGVVLSGGQPISLVEIPDKKRDRVAEILTEATGLGIIELKQ